MHAFRVLASATLFSFVYAKKITLIPIAVGKNGLTFEPNSVTANVGDIVEFHFYPKNHSVAQGSFNDPCHAGSVADPIFSGFMPVASGAGNKAFQVVITNASAPLWFYCSQGKHCQSGMVMAVNAPKQGAKTLEAYAANAKSASSPSTNPANVHGGKIVAVAAANGPTDSTSSHWSGETASASSHWSGSTTTTASDNAYGSAPTSSQANANDAPASDTPNLTKTTAVVGPSTESTATGSPTSSVVPILTGAATMAMDVSMGWISSVYIAGFLGTVVAAWV